MARDFSKSSHTYVIKKQIKFDQLRLYKYPRPGDRQKKMTFWKDDTDLMTQL